MWRPALVVICLLLVAGCSRVGEGKAVGVCQLLSQGQVEAAVGAVDAPKRSSLGNSCFYDGATSVRIYLGPSEGFDQALAATPNAVRISDREFVWSDKERAGAELRSTKARISIVLSGPLASQDRAGVLARSVGAQA